MARRAGVAAWRRIRESADARVAMFLAFITFVPMSFTARGEVSADTKTYLTLDPGQLLSSARFMWDPSVGAGTVPHQNIGYLFPLGPYYWTLDRLGIPDWLAQRWLWAILVFAASYGTYRLLRWLGWTVAGSLVAAVSYGFSPYLLSYLARLSAILFPWAAMPWMILLAARAARERSWARAAQFAVVVALVGSVNATSLIFAGLAPVIWLIGDAASRRVPTRAVLAAAARIGLLSAAVSAWWIAGLRVQGTYGLPVLDYTESYQTVASASTPPEILRGLGYWFFYGGDRLDPWIGPAFPYFNAPAVMFVSFGLAGLSVLGLLAPFRGRASMMVLFLAGLVLSVGAAPLGDSSLYGTLYETFATDTTAGAALRSTPRAAPLVVLALACGFGAGTEAARSWLRGRRSERVRQVAPLAPVAAAGLVFVNLLPWFVGDAASASLLRPDTLPSATTELADYLNSSTNGRIYTIPGADFADYRWGGTVDPVLPGLTDRSVLYRELIPQGSPGTADLLDALERRLAEGWFEPASLEPVAALFDIDTIVVRNDLQHERYRLARPGPLWTDVTSVLGTPDHAGPLTTDQTRITLVDEITLARGDAAAEYPITAAFEIDESDGLAVHDASSPLIVAGNGDGIVDLAAAGLLTGARTVLYAADLDDLASESASAPSWVITDTNRKQGRRWSSIGANLGALEAVDPLVLDDDPNDSDLGLFPDETTDDQTIAVHVGEIAHVAASSYGSRIVYTAEDAPNFAVDGDLTTAWRAGIADPATGLDLVVDFAEPETLTALHLVQPQVGANNRFVTRVEVATDTGAAAFDLDESSRAAEGQRLDLAGLGAAAPTSTLTVTVVADNVGELSTYVGQPGVGFAEVTPVRADGTSVVDDRSVRLPLTADLDIGADDPLTYLLTRQRIDPATPNRQSPEPSLDRTFDVPDDRTFVLTGQARLANTADDSVISTLLDGPATGTDVSAIASSRLPGSVESWGGAAVDGDVDTAWQTPFDAAVGATLTVTQPEPADVEELTLTWRSDDRHSEPLQLTVTDGPTSFQVDVAANETAQSNGLSTATIAVPAFTASSTTITVDSVTDAFVPEYYSGAPRLLPLAIAEISLGVPGSASGTAALIDTGCRSDLLTIDGQPYPVTVTGDGDGVLDVTACSNALDLSPGDHRIVATDGRTTGIDIDRLVLASGTSTIPTPAPTVAGSITIESESATSIDATLSATEDTTWLILPQSLNAGWTARLDGDDLGAPHLINGFANGWLIPAGTAGRPIELRWTPQTSINIGLAISALTGLLLVALVVVASVRRREDAEVKEVPAPTPKQSQLTVLAAVTAIGFLIVGGPFAALASVVVSIVAGVGRRRASLLLAAGVTSVAWAAVSGLIIALEWRYDYANGPDWPLRFVWATPLTWIAVAAIVTHVLWSCSSARTPATASDR